MILAHASDGMLKFCKIAPMNQHTLQYILDGLRVSEVTATLTFWVDYSFKKDIQIRNQI